jgi:hypothetical protein
LEAWINFDRQITCRAALSNSRNVLQADKRNSIVSNFVVAALRCRAFFKDFSLGVQKFLISKFLIVS